MPLSGVGRNRALARVAEVAAAGEPLTTEITQDRGANQVHLFYPQCASVVDLFASVEKLETSYHHPVRVLGIDCGTEFTGYGVVGQGAAGDLAPLAAGVIRLSAKEPLPVRLARIFEELSQVIAEHRPDVVAIEDVFYAVNVKSALKLGQVRGVAMLAAASNGLQVCEYAPLAIKSAVVGYGKADKSQVQQMVKVLLRLPEIPQPPDVADALAIAICHLHTAATLERQQTAAGRPG
jgi:crossover junction endodeoxyribonuclease RuvC